MKNTRQTQVNTHRDAWVEINLETVAHNVKQFRDNIPKDKKILGIVKADAYGHGAAMIAPTMLASGIDMLGVASIDEGLDLRREKINCDILVVGAVPVWSFEIAAENIFLSTATLYIPINSSFELIISSLCLFLEIILLIRSCTAKSEINVFCKSFNLLEFSPSASKLSQFKNCDFNFS